MGAYELISGLLNGEDDTTIVVHTGVALLTFWIVGRIAIAVWYQLDAWKATETTIIAHTTGPVTDVDAALADADTELTADPAEEEQPQPAATVTVPEDADETSATKAA